jgi:hypothetical protein
VGEKAVQAGFRRAIRHSTMRRIALIPGVLGLAIALVGCGGSGSRYSTSRAVAAPATTSPVTPPNSPGALQAEAGAAAAGDIPDNQTFLAFSNDRTGYSIKYPEGWAQQGSGRTVIFRDRNNLVRIVVNPGQAPTAASVRRDVALLSGGKAQSTPQTLSLRGGRALKTVYSTVSTPNPVTGKRVTLVVDRYYLWRAGRIAVIDLGTPQGVDNVDAYRLMIESFRWR